jgi:hypothetical protein
MQRDDRAYLNDIVEACAAIESALSGLDLAAYRADRLVRSAVEREFTIVGEAVAVLSRVAPQVVAQITQARRIVDSATSSRTNTRPSTMPWSGSLPSTTSLSCGVSVRRSLQSVVQRANNGIQTDNAPRCR